jgi:hypothetical protein
LNPFFKAITRVALWFAKIGDTTHVEMASDAWLKDREELGIVNDVRTYDDRKST